MDNDAFRPDKTEEEYHFSETESSSVFTEESPQKNVFERIKRKNIITAVVVLVIVLGVYKIIEALLTSSAKSTKPVAPAVAIQQKPQMTVSTVAAQQAAEQVAISTLSEKINTLETQNQANIEKLSTQITELQNTLSSLDTRLNTLNGAVQDLITKEQQLAEQKAAKKARAKGAYRSIKPIYFVRALVPGRAWLETKSGKTVTVSIGHNLPGYGIVTVINTDLGTITTSTGAIIGYSPDDS